MRSKTLMPSKSFFHRRGRTQAAGLGSMKMKKSKRKALLPNHLIIKKPQGAALISATNLAKIIVNSASPKIHTRYQNVRLGRPISI